MRLISLITVLIISSIGFAQSKIGVDANYALDMESKGFQWKKDGQPKDVYSILSESGFTKARIRLWTGDEGMNGLKYAVETAKRARNAGLQPYLVIFLSENWADFVKQPVPVIWKDLSYEDKLKAVEAYSKRATEEFIKRDINIEWFEIGNEIDFGICGEFEEQWANRVSLEYMQTKIWPRMAPIIRASQAGVKSARPDAKFILHLTQFQNTEYCTAFWKYMLSQNVQIDFAGISYFPTNTKPEERSIDFLNKQVDALHAGVNRPIMICESAYPNSGNFTGQFADWNKPIEGYTQDNAGQSKWISDMKSMVTGNDKIAAWFYWSPEWAGEGMWEAFALFDGNGNARPAISSQTQPATQPASSDLNIYFGNLHAHTSVSDGVGTPIEAFEYARDTGKLDFMAITEHNHLMGGDKATHEQRIALYQTLIDAADQFNQEGKFVAIYGQEYSSMSKGNHVNLFDIKKVIDVPNGEFDDLLIWMDKNRDSSSQLAVMQMNHPGLGYNTKGIGKNEYGRDDFGDDAGWVAKMGPVTQLIEVLNGEPPRGTVSNRSPQVTDDKYDLFLLQGFKIAPVGDQDNHQKNWGTVNDTRTAILAPKLDRKSILDAMRSRHVYATEDKNLKIILHINHALPGDIIRAQSFPTPLTVDCQIDDPDEPDAKYSIDAVIGTVGDRSTKVLKNFEATGNSNGHPLLLHDLAIQSEKDFLYFKITQTSSAGVDRAWIAPVWFSSK